MKTKRRTAEVNRDQLEKLVLMGFVAALIIEWQDLAIKQLQQQVAAKAERETAKSIQRKGIDTELMETLRNIFPDKTDQYEKG